MVEEEVVALKGEVAVEEEAPPKTPPPLLLLLDPNPPGAVVVGVVLGRSRTYSFIVHK